MLYRFVVQLLVVLFGIFVAFTSMGGPLDHWNWRNPVPQGNSLLGVTANDERYVAVGDHGTIVTSRDGATWSEHPSGTLATLRAVAFGAGRFVAVGDFGTILTSTNATNWQFSIAATLTALRGVTYAGDAFLAVGDNGLVLSSPDGSSWSLVHSGPYTLEDVAFGNGVAVAVGGTAPTNRWTDGNAVVLTSSNRLDWTAHESGFPSRVYSVCFGNGLFAATTSDLDLYTRGVPSVGTSSNGVHWAHHLSPYYLSDVANGSNSFVALGPAGFGVIYSYDGGTWLTNNEPLPQMRPQGLTHGPGGFVTVGLYGATARSEDGFFWSRVSPLWAYEIVDIDYGNGRFIALAVSTEGGSNVWVSLDGAAWEGHALPHQTPPSLTFGNGVFVGSTEDGQILTTSNGVEWITYESGYARLWQQTFCEDLFTVGIWGSEDVLTSTNGITWTLVPASGGLVCGLSVSGNVNFNSVANGKGIYVATTWNGEIWSSENGQDWILRQEAAPMITNEFSMTYPALYNVTFGGGMFVAVGGDGDFGGVYGTKPIRGTIYTSPNGITWSRASIGVTDILKSAVYGNGTFLAIGYRSPTILQSDPFTSLSIKPAAAPRLLVEGPLGAAVDIEASETPSGNWSTVHSATLGTAPYEWTDTSSSARRFYRVVLKP